ncbi:hypothetical protein SEA_CHERRYONLIM_54 [Gordonia phage CherryonLim]|uniref:Uncharacterized protein n=1 Tax=Gordonia phage CherryonLim TaxID=2652411 RepID=A0A5P8D9Z4_9CAUD|nr:hypothetical protein PP994_gp54 [Gordonia phage CherryonLim]QFP95807.1 hypothetical protein SEA_CHERRYONLIM_54 [Gordonia phage CherryonLim]
MSNPTTVTACDRSMTTLTPIWSLRLPLRPVAEPP